MAHRAHEREGGLGGQHLPGIGTMQPSLRHYGMGETMPGGQGFHPAGFTDGVPGIPLGFHVHGFDHPMGTEIAAVISGKVIAPQGPVIAIAERNRGVVLKPGMAVFLQIPEMLMGIDDGKRGPARVHGAPRESIWAGR